MCIECDDVSTACLLSDTCMISLCAHDGEIYGSYIIIYLYVSDVIDTMGIYYDGY